ncbi:protein-export chaperone SecB [Aestuariispira ectoiniformans]|uniref:protein-export chaperone SecB n=1 Tax=Aestuariispira ectoiniformans TaxID=2775080 RepID=UPI00223BBF0D|nr:protein-export chaperone SecB [Aestuariispira ectoiniformans]
MADTDNQTNEQAEASEGAAQGNQMPFSIMVQYLKDLSFENPNAPMVFTKNRENQELDVNVDVTVQQLSQTDYEVSVHLRGQSKDGDDTHYLVEQVYGGVTRIAEGLQQELMQMILFVEIPRLLFPYARSIFSEAVANGGFPAVMLAPVDFMDLFRQRVAAAQAAEAEKEGNGEENATA